MSRILAVLLCLACGGRGQGADVQPDTDNVMIGEEAFDVFELVPETTVCSPTTSANGYKDLCDGTIQAPDLRLWEKASSYQSWDEAKSRCEDLVLAGKDDWRLPDIDELRGLILGCPKTHVSGSCGVHANPKCTEEKKCFSKEDCWPCSMNGGPGGNGSYLDPLFLEPDRMYWSSTMAEMVMAEKRAWGVSFYDGNVRVAPVTDFQQARCVRGP